MARKTLDVEITDDNRDKGKLFKLDEMPASQGERWALRALLALGRSGIDIPDNVMGAGFAGVAMLGLKAFFAMNVADAEDLMAEMFRCVRIYPDPRSNPGVLRDLIEDDIEEISTRVKLRMEVLNLHLGFSITGDDSTSESPTPAPVTSSNVQTSRVPSTHSFQAVKRR